MRADRLLRLLWVLRREGAVVSTGDLAAELEVSTRTVLRDVEALSASGVPVYTERGRHGGVALLAGYRPEVIGLTPEEAFALTAVTSLATAGALGLHDTVASAIGKIGAANGARHIAQIRRAVLIDPHGWLPGRRPSWLPDVLAAVQEHLTITFRYTSGSTGAESDVKAYPRGVLCAASDWYLVAETGDGTTRFYRLDRLDDVRVGAPAPPRPDFDLEAEWYRARAEFATRFTPVQARLLVRPVVLGQLRSLVHIDDTEAEGPGWIRVDATFADISHALEVLPRIAGSLKVVRPATLRAAIAALAEELAAAAQAAAGSADT